MIPSLASSYSHPLRILTKFNLERETNKVYSKRKSRKKETGERETGEREREWERAGSVTSVFQKIPYSSDSTKEKQIDDDKNNLLFCHTQPWKIPSTHDL